MSALFSSLRETRPVTDYFNLKTVTMKILILLMALLLTGGAEALAVEKQSRSPYSLISAPGKTKRLLKKRHKKATHRKEYNLRRVLRKHKC